MKPNDTILKQYEQNYLAKKFKLRNVTMVVLNSTGFRIFEHRLIHHRNKEKLGYKTYHRLHSFRYDFRTYKLCQKDPTRPWSFKNSRQTDEMEIDNSQTRLI